MALGVVQLGVITKLGAKVVTACGNLGPILVEAMGNREVTGADAERMAALALEGEDLNVIHQGVEVLDNEARDLLIRALSVGVRRIVEIGRGDLVQRRPVHE